MIEENLYLLDNVVTKSGTIGKVVGFDRNGDEKLVRIRTRPNILGFGESFLVKREELRKIKSLKVNHG